MRLSGVFKANDQPKMSTYCVVPASIKGGPHERTKSIYRVDGRVEICGWYLLAMSGLGHIDLAVGDDVPFSSQVELYKHAAILKGPGDIG